MAKQVVAQAKAGRNVVRLFQGDPFVGAGGPALALALGKAKLGFELVAGVSTVTGVPSYAGVPLTDAAHHSFTTVDLAHAEPDWPALRGRRDPRGARASTPRTPVGWPSRSSPAGVPGSHAGVADRGRLDPGAAHRRGQPRPARAGRGHRPDHRRRPGRGRRRRRGQAARQALLVRDPGAVRLEGAGAPYQGAGRRAVRAAARARRGAGRGADDRGRAAPHPGPDGAGDQGPGPGPLPVGRLHVGQRVEGRPRADRGLRPGRPGLRRHQDRLHRRGDRRCRHGVRHQARPGPVRRAVERGPAGRLRPVRRHPRPDRPGAAAAGRHRDRDPGRRA